KQTDVKPVRQSFLASGSCQPEVCQVVGRLIYNDHILCYGRPIPCAAPMGWALYFRKIHVGQQHFQCTLEVVGLTLDPHGPVKVAPIDSPQTITVKTGGSFGADIQWPVMDESDLCPSNFTPYGNYTAPGVITAKLSGGHTADASSVF